MMGSIRRLALRALSYLFSDRVADRMTRFFGGKLVGQLRDETTDELLEALLESMDAAFCVSRSYRKNLDGFSAIYVFTTADGSAGATARFRDGQMEVDDRTADSWTAKVTFKDASALRRFLFAERQDILDSLLANDVEVEGNVNYIYKFGFMTRDLERRLGLLA